jgi:hypothetical protein
MVWLLIILGSWSCGRGEKARTTSEGPIPVRDLSSARTLDDIFKAKTEVQLELTGESALAAITDMAVDAKGNFIIADGVRLNRVWIFSPEGRFLRILGATGQGPGEYSSPLSIAVNREGEILINDYSQMKLIFYDREYRYERDLKAIRGHYLHVNSGNQIYLYEGMVPAVARRVFDTIKALNKTGKLIVSFAPLPATAIKTRFSKLADGMDIDRNDQIYEMNSLYYQVRKYTPAGELIKSFGNPDVRYTVETGERPPLLNGPFCLDKGIVIVQRENFLDIYDNEGNLTVSGIPCDYKIIHAQGNAIYLEAWDDAGTQGEGANPKIIRYH